MAIAALFNIPGTPEEWAQWSFCNAAQHRDENRVIFQTLGKELPEYVLDPFDPQNPGVWFDQHQIMHKNTDALLGISGFDLTDVDFNDKNQLAGWIYLHANEHFQAGNILRIG